MKHYKSIIVLVLVIICAGAFWFSLDKEPNKEVNCYTVSSEETVSLPQAQEDRQFLITSKDRLTAFEESFGVDLSDSVNQDIFKNSNILILVSNDIAACDLDSIFIDDNNEPHMIVNKEDANEYKTWYFIATIDKDYGETMNLSRWEKY